MTGAKALIDFLAHETSGEIIAVQGHRAQSDRLVSMRRQAAGLGYRGHWAAAAASEGGGARGGVAALTTADVTIAEPPCLSQVELPSGRSIAARIHWGTPQKNDRDGRPLA